MATNTETETRRRIEEAVAGWRTRGWTTIVLKESEDGEWLATQRGVAVAGRGETAAQAATDYCRRVEQGGERGDE